MEAIFLTFFAVIIFTAFSAFFSGSETGSISANRLYLRRLQMSGDMRADKVLHLLSDTQKVLTVTLVGTNISNILCTLFAERFFSRLLKILDLEKSAASAEVVSLLFMTPFLLMFAEILPKQYFREKADDLMLTVQRPLRFFSKLFIPAVTAFNAVTYVILWPFGVKKGQRNSRLTKEDLRYLVGSGDLNGEEGMPSPPENRRVSMIQSIFSLEKTLVREVMKPLVDLIALPMDEASVEIVLKTARKSGFSRIPVYEDNIVNMVGYINIYDILREEEDHKNITEYVRKPYYVPETKRIDDLLQELLSKHISVAIAFDEYGGCSGFVTLEDILEEIVGEIEDEFDERSIMYYEEKPGTYIIDPRMDLDDLREEPGIDLPKRNCETLGGFVYSTLGRVPEQDEVLKYGTYHIQIMEVKPPKIARIRVTIQNQ